MSCIYRKPITHSSGEVNGKNINIVASHYNGTCWYSGPCETCGNETPHNQDGHISLTLAVETGEAAEQERELDMVQQEQAYRQENSAQEGKRYKSLVFRVRVKLGKERTDVWRDQTNNLYVLPINAKEEAKRENDRKIFLPLYFF